MRFARTLVVLTIATLAAGCHVWKDYEAVRGSDGGSDEPVPWWDSTYPRRIEVEAVADVVGSEPIVLPIVLGDTIDPIELREEGDDLRAVVNGEEVARELTKVSDDELVLWVRFPKAPSPSDDVHLYWGNPDAAIPDSPWTDHEAAFHFEEDFQSSVPGGERFRAINDPSIAPGDGRLGGGASIPPWPGSVRMYDGEFFESGAETFAFSFRGRRSTDDGRSVMQVPDPCRVVNVLRTETRETEARWIDPVTCTGEDDPVTSVTVPVDLMDGAWHDVVVTVDVEAGSLALTVDDDHASVPISGGDVVMSRWDLRGGDSDDPPGEFLFDEARVAPFARSAEEATLAVSSVRGEAFDLGEIEDL